MEQIRSAIDEVKTCLDEAASKPGGAKSADVARAMRAFVTGCYLRHLQITSNNGDKIEQILVALYGPADRPEDGLLDIKRQLCLLARLFAWGAAVLGAATIGLLFKVAEKILL